MKIYDFWRDRLQCISKPPGCADVIAQWGVMNLPARAQPPCISVPEVPPSQPACYRPLFRSLPVLSPGHLILAALPRTASSFVMSSLKMLLRPLSWHKASWASGSDHTRLVRLWTTCWFFVPFHTDCHLDPSALLFPPQYLYSTIFKLEFLFAWWFLRCILISFNQLPY